jgi:hypothetical protein
VSASEHTTAIWMLTIAWLFSCGVNAFCFWLLSERVESLIRWFGQQVEINKAFARALDAERKA